MKSSENAKTRYFFLEPPNPILSATSHCPSFPPLGAERVQRALAQPFRLEGRDLFVSASVGVALGSAGYQNVEEMLRDADTAMYWAKTRAKTATPCSTRRCTRSFRPG